MKLIEWLKRNPCKECDYYNDNGVCQSKKCATSNPYVTFFDRLFCEPYKAENKKVDCKATKCENCTNHGYCDYEPYKVESEVEK